MYMIEVNPLSFHLNYIACVKYVKLLTFLLMSEDKSICFFLRVKPKLNIFILSSSNVDSDTIHDLVNIQNRDN